MLRPRLRIPRAPRLGLGVPSLPSSSFLQTAPLQRLMHTIPELEHKFMKDGVPELFTPFGFDVAWTQYQSMVLNKLNALTAGTDFEAKDLKSVLLSTAREPAWAPIFNHASMAHNNHFFFKHLAPQPVEMPAALEQHLTHSFGSIETLRREMIYTASAMFGPGFVWLVKVDQPGLFASFQVVATYLAGSPYPGAHWRRQDVDLTTAVGSSEQGIEAGRKFLEDTAYGVGRRTPAAQKRHTHAPGGTDIVPVLCLNVWEHVYLPDYGVAGKQAFAEKWWNCVDWTKVNEESNLKRMAPST